MLHVNHIPGKYIKETIMIYQQTSDLEKIITLHEQIFPTPFPCDKYHRRLKKGQTLLSFLFISNQMEPVGYAVVAVEKQSMHLWLGGVLPHARRHGYTGKFFDFIMDYALKYHLDWLTLNTDNRKIDSLRMAIKNGFDIFATGQSDYGDGIRVCLRRRVTRPINLRISLTRKCNYNCFFCHGDGVPEQTNNMSMPQIENILAQAAKLRLKTVTFTGGEPLLAEQTLLHGLYYCSNMGACPKLKLVTNGALLDKKLADKLKEFPNLRINLSLHGADADTCMRITGSRSAFSLACKTIDILASRKIPFRLNTVLLRGTNDAPEQISQLLKFALERNIGNITFLELQTPEKSIGEKCHMNFLTMIDTVVRQAERMGQLDQLDDTPRKRAYCLHSESSRLNLAFFRLSCLAGCLGCCSHRDETIGPDGMLYPCFMSASACGDAVQDLYSALGESASFVQRRIQENFKPPLA